jgi:hypothetical protein
MSGSISGDLSSMPVGMVFESLMQGHAMPAGVDHPPWS